MKQATKNPVLAIRFTDLDAMIDFARGALDRDQEWLVVRADAGMPEWHGRSAANNYVLRRSTDLDVMEDRIVARIPGFCPHCGLVLKDGQCPDEEGHYY